MSLLLEIQDGAVGNELPLPVLLRKCQVLSARLGHEPLRDWTRSEIEGYASAEDLPAYRKTAALEAVGSFMQGGLRFWPRLSIPRGVVPEDRRSRLFAHQFLQGVAELEPLAASPPDTVLSISWPADAVALYGSRIYQDMACLEAHVEISPHMITGVLDTIRNRVLTFALEIWKEAPDAGEAPGVGETQVSPQRVDQIFNTYVLAPTAAVTLGGGEISQTVDVTVTPGDLEGLRAALARLGVPGSDIDDLERALRADETADGAGALGPETAKWLERFRDKAGSHAVNLANGVTAGVLTELLMHFVS